MRNRHPELMEIMGVSRNKHIKNYSNRGELHLPILTIDVVFDDRKPRLFIADFDPRQQRKKF